MVVMSTQRPNKRTSGNGAITLLFHIGRPCRAVPECGRWAESRLRA